MEDGVTDFDPGPGWRQITSSEYMHERHLGRPTMTSETGVPLSVDARKVFWAQREPVPPLPTEPRTSIKVTYRAQPAELRERAQEDWVLRDSPLQWMSDHAEYRDAGSLLKLITGFEVLAGPLMQDEITWEATAERVRRETAKAVLEQISPYFDGYYSGRKGSPIDDIAREFRVPGFEAGEQGADMPPEDGTDSGENATASSSNLDRADGTGPAVMPLAPLGLRITDDYTPSAVRMAQLARESYLLAGERGASTWRHSLLAHVFDVIETDDSDELRGALTSLSDLVALWIQAVDQRGW